MEKIRKYRFLRFPGGKTKAVTLSYDDGSCFDLRLAEIVNQYHMKVTFNINSGYLLSSPDGFHLNAQEVSRYLLGTGHEIAVHGKYHRAPGKLRAIDGIRDILECRTELEEQFGIIVRGMAYPDSGIREFQNGASNANIRQYLIDLGIVYARTLGQDNRLFGLPNDWYCWMPTAHHDNPEIFDYIREFTEMDPNQEYIASRTPKLFYLWGHSHEFDRNGNWDRITEICKCLGEREDVWYATNMEIYEYVSAYDGLVVSADGSRIFNPTLIPVYFDADGELYTVNSGETIEI
ncbi:MAG: polysaccharide deacetylase family protein [Fusicatenibacter sp.]